MIEVVASLALLSMLLVGILRSFASNQRQLTLVSQIQVANTALDELLAGWFEVDEPFPVHESGTCGPNGSLTWNCTVVSRRQIEQDVAAEILKVEVFSNQSFKPLTSVQIIQRLPETEGSR